MMDASHKIQPGGGAVAENCLFAAKRLEVSSADPMDELVRRDRVLRIGAWVRWHFGVQARG